MGKFSLDMEEFAKRAKAGADNVVRKVMIDVTSSIIQKSPVDTGRFRANWILGVNYMPSGTNISMDKSGASTIGRIAAEIPAKAAGPTYILANNLPYAQRLEDGYSKQAPVGMVGLTVVEFQSFVDKAARSFR